MIAGITPVAVESLKTRRAFARSSVTFVPIGDASEASEMKI
jgi:hypothetical protein